MISVKFKVLCTCLITIGLSSCALQPKSVAPLINENNNVASESLSKSGNLPYDIEGKLFTPLLSAYNFEEKGDASWYGEPFHGRKTANGEVYDMHEISAAHKTLPLPSYVRVTNLSNGRSLVVRVNDRGPFIDDRIIDLSYAAAKKLGFIEAGLARVYIKSVDPEKPQQSPENVGLVAQLPELNQTYDQKSDDSQVAKGLNQRKHRMNEDHFITRER